MSIDKIPLDARGVVRESKVMATIEDIGHDAPWNSYGWEGTVESIDGTPITLTISKYDVADVIAHGETSPGWDGESATVILLKDGRFASWESWWDATGSGFCCDAYGGNAVVWFSSSVTAATSRMSEKALELIRDQIKAKV